MVSILDLGLYFDESPINLAGVGVGGRGKGKGRDTAPL